MVLPFGPLLQQESTTLVEQKDRDGAMKEPETMRFELAGAADCAIVLVHENDTVQPGAAHGWAEPGPADAADPSVGSCRDANPIPRPARGLRSVIPSIPSTQGSDSTPTRQYATA